MEIKDKLNKPYTSKQRADFIVFNNHNKGYEIKELVRLADRYYQESSIKRASEENLDNVIEVHQENMSDSISSYTKRLLSNLFKNKEKVNTQTEEELISF